MVVYFGQPPKLEALIQEIIGYAQKARKEGVIVLEKEAKNIIAPVYKKELDIIVPSLINYLSVKTEINEFLKDVIIIPVDEILVNLVINNLYPNQELPSKGKGMTYICSYVPNDVSAINRILKTKYKVIDLNIVLNK